MMRSFATLMLVLVHAGSAFGSGALDVRQSPPPDARNLVVMVKARTSQGETLLGAGIIISQTPQETLILTARHNLQEAVGSDFYAGITVEFRTRPGRPVTAQPVQESISRHDIALLRVPATEAPDVLSAGAAVLAPRTVVDSVIERVVAIGYGGGIAWYQAASPQRARRLSAAELEIETSSYMPGQSGGAVFTEDWALLGMIVEVTARSARALPIDLILDELRRTRYGVLLTESPAVAVNDARRALAARTIRWDAPTVASALSGGDLETLESFVTAGMEPAMLLEAFGTPGPDKTSAAQTFFARTRGNPRAIRWLERVLAGGFDPNWTIPTATLKREGLLQSTVRAGNAPAILAMLQAGASPHAYQELFLTTADLARFILPAIYIVEHTILTRDEKRAVLEALVAAGMVVPTVPDARRNTAQFPELSELSAKAEQLAGIPVRPSPSLGSRPRTPVCESATRRTKFDWCAFVAGLPARVQAIDRDYVGFWRLELVGLMNVLDDRAYFLGYEETGGLDVVEVTRDTRQWRVLRFMEPAAGMGLCTAESDGFRRDRCWRRVSMQYNPDAGEFLVENYYKFRALRAQAATAPAAAPVAAPPATRTPVTPAPAAAGNLTPLAETPFTAPLGQLLLLGTGPPLSDDVLTALTLGQIRLEQWRWSQIDRELQTDRESVKPRLNPRRPAFLLEWERLSAEAPALEKPLLLALLGADPSWRVLERFPEWDPKVPAVVDAFVFKRESVVGREPAFAARTLAPVMRQFLQTAAAAAPRRLAIVVDLARPTYDFGRSRLIFTQADPGLEAVTKPQPAISLLMSVDAPKMAVFMPATTVPARARSTELVPPFELERPVDFRAKLDARPPGRASSAECRNTGRAVFRRRGPAGLDARLRSHAAARRHPDAARSR